MDNSKKMIQRKDLKFFREMLVAVKDDCGENDAKEQLCELIEWYDKYLVNDLKDKINEMKRDLYKKMKDSKGERNKMFYNAYQELKKIDLK